MTTCPFCLETIKEGARKCPHCQASLAKEAEASQDVLLADKGLVKFGKFALFIFGLFAFVVYTAMGFRIQDSVKEIDEKLKEVDQKSRNIADVYSQIRDIRVTAREKALDD